MRDKKERNYKVKEAIHRGELVKNAIKRGVKIWVVCKELNIGRRTYYDWIEKRDLSLDIVLRIGEIINYDFSESLGLKMNGKSNKYQQEYEDIDFLRKELFETYQKYVKSLEEINDLKKLLSINQRGK